MRHRDKVEAVATGWIGCACIVVAALALNGVLFVIGIALLSYSFLATR